MPKQEPKQNFLKIYLRSRKQIILDNLIGGIAWGVGSAIGATLIIGLISFVFVKTRNVPLIGDLLTQIGQEVTESKQETKEILNGDDH
ncbi:hypothetical protein JW766_00735 [Candidatus Dojkabacteria bacterium]|nr:hypothetical protein [Candidatus Dojkabacteria bacterium]